MQKLNFINKCYEEFQIGEDENAVIRINTRDMKILERMKIASENLKEIAKEYEALKDDNDNELNVDKAIEVLAECDKKARNQIDYIFGAGTSKIAFASMDCCSIVDGQPVFMNFFDEISTFIEKAIIKEQGRSAKKISKYTLQAKKFK